MFAAVVEFAMVSVGMFVSSAGVAVAVIAVVAYTVYNRLNRNKLLCIRQRDILNTRLKAKVASKTENDQDKFFEVRDHLERLVEGLVDGGLDDVRLTPLSTHPQYMSICWKYHEQLAATLTEAIHAIINESGEFDGIPIKLNTILEEVSNDVETLPELKAAQKKCAVPLAEDLEEKNYEDLLATAILNKIISNSQTKKKIPNGNARNSKHRLQQSGGLSADNSANNGPSSSSKVSLTVEEYAEEVTAAGYSTYSDIEGDYDDGYNEGDDEDDERSQSAIGIFMSNAKLLRGHQTPLPEFGSDTVHGTDGGTADPDDQEISTTVDSWKDNWLFQKKKVDRLTGSNNYHHHPVPVPMLVPNPCEVTRPLIGDRDADEMSDLSDYSNSALDDYTDSDLEQQTTKLLDADHRCNGSVDRLMFGSHSSEEENALHWDPVVEACNKHVALSQVDSGQGSMDHQRDSDNSPEINEKPVPRPRSSITLNNTDSEVNSVSSEDALIVLDDEPSPPKPGTIAEREHSKWEKAPPLLNNPYSAENIEKRKYKSLFGSRSSSDASLKNLNNADSASESLKIVCGPLIPDTQRYGRDYYINQSGELQTKRKQTELVTKTTGRGGEDDGPAGANGKQRDRLVRVCSWSDRRDGYDGSRKAPIAKSPDNDVCHTMPSVKELAKQFSSNNTIVIQNPNRQIHSLTARSISREYRAGLGLKIREKNGHAKHDSDDSGNGSARSEDAIAAPVQPVAAACVNETTVD